jgi:serine/threonine-protein kinase HipA
MARRRTYVPLQVCLNGRKVGMLRRAVSGAIDFQYDQDWLDWTHAIPVSLSLPLREDKYTGAPVIAVFDNLLPDNDDIRKRLAEKAQADGTDAYSLLAAIGRDCVGALQFLGQGEDPGPAGVVSGRPVTDEAIAGILSNLHRSPLGLTQDDEFRISIAGAQEKTALLYWKKRWHIPHGTTATTHIFKPQIGILPNGIDLSHSVENEYLCLEIIHALGLPAARSSIAEFAGHHVLVVERFDRRWTKDKRLLRLPQEDCCQALSVSPSHKYETDGGPGIRAILQFLKGSDTPEEDRRCFLKAQIIFWLLGATDGHAKNFSVYLAPGGRFRLTPLYDVMSAQPAVDAGHIRRNRMKLAMAIGRNRHYGVYAIAPRHFLQTAKLCGMPQGTVQDIFDELCGVIPKAIETSLTGLPREFPERIALSITNGVLSRLQTWRGDPENID